MYEWTYELSALVAGLGAGFILGHTFAKRGKELIEKAKAEAEARSVELMDTAQKLRFAAETYRKKYDDLKEEILKKAKEQL